MKKVEQLRDFHLNHTTHTGEPFYPKTTVEGVEGLNEIINKGSITKVTWQELKDLRDNSELVPGNLYRITDYQCTTSQENTRSAGHQFDIVLLALSENKLAEEGWVMEHPTDIYDVTFVDGITKKCYLYNINDGYNTYNIVDVQTLLGIDGAAKDAEFTINEESKTVSMIGEGYESNDLDVENLTYNYFQNSNLSAWKVWYSLDNDINRFAWADDSSQGEPAKIVVKNALAIPVSFKTYYRNPSLDGTSLSSSDMYYGWSSEQSENRWTASEIPSAGDSIYSSRGGVAQRDYSIDEYIPPKEDAPGKGVIYRLIDEFNNDIKYDFKNIQFKRKLTNGQYDENGDETWCYTLNLWYNNACQDASIVGNTLPDEEGHIKGVYDNKIGYTTANDRGYYEINTFAFVIGDNVILSFENFGYGGIYSNTIGNCSYYNTIGNSFQYNVIRNGFFNNIIGNDFIGNIVGNGFRDMTIDNETSFKNYGNGGVELATKNDI